MEFGFQGGGGGAAVPYVESVTGLNTDNTDPQNPIVEISVDGSTITGLGTPASPLVASLLIPSGVFGITDSLGVYTYYATLTLAMAAADGGDTIEMFANVTENADVTITLKDAVNINGNGYTYTLKTNTAISAFIDNGIAINITISNITINRIGTAGTGISITGASYLKCASTNLTCTSGTIALVVNNASAEIYSVNAKGYNPVVAITNGNIYNSELRSVNGTGLQISAGSANNCTAYGLGADGIYMLGGRLVDCIGIGQTNSGISAYGGTMQGCTGYGFGGSGIYINSQSMIIMSCVGYSIAGSGIFSNSYYTLNCDGYSSAGAGIGMINGTLNGCSGYSTATSGIYASNSGASISEIRSCQARSTAGIALVMDNATSGCKIYNTEVNCLWNNIAGYGIKVLVSNTEIVNCLVEVTNATANAIYAATPLTAKYANNAFRGCTTPISANITQSIVNTQDNKGNILI